MVEFGDIQKRLTEILIDGSGLYIGDKLTDLLKPYLVKSLKQYTKPVTLIGISMIDLFIPRIREFPWIGDWLELWGKLGVKDVITSIIDKPEFCWSQDENTIKCINFDTTTVTVKVDGKEVTPTIQGTADEFTISLPSPLSSGSHDLVVVGNIKCFRGKIYV
ncbi:MAG: hypothetical protein QW607_10155 [Desulfurococcaceae archaeon]